MKRSAKTIIGTLALLGFLSVTMFWSAGMHQGDNHNCISATIQNEVCPNATTPEAAVFHLQTLQSFTAYILQMSQLSTLLLVLAFVVLAALAGLFRNLALGILVRRNVVPAISPPGQYRHWLSLLEHSPSFSTGRA